MVWSSRKWRRFLGVYPGGDGFLPIHKGMVGAWSDLTRIGVWPSLYTLNSQWQGRFSNSISSTLLGVKKKT